VTDELPARFAAILAQEKYQADLDLDKSLNRLWDDLAARGVYYSSANEFQTKQCLESNIQARLTTVLNTASRVLASASAREAREYKEDIDRLAIDWLGGHIDACQVRLMDLCAKIALNVPATVDLGRDRLIASLEAELSMIPVERKREEPSPQGDIPSSGSGMNPGKAICVFISHSHQDASLVKSVIELLRSALNLSSD